jgi:hypothetical protein
MAVAGEDPVVAAQLPVQLPVGGDAVGLDVDEELQRGAVVRVDAAAPRADQGGKRVQVERGERAGRVEVRGIVGDEQVAVDEVDVRLDAGEAVRERVVQRPGVQVVVVRVGVA